MLTCTRLIPRFCPNAHHHGSLPQQLGVVWDLLLKTDPEGPTLIFHAACPHDWSVHDELLSVCACSTPKPRNSADEYRDPPQCVRHELRRPHPARHVDASARSLDRVQHDQYWQDLARLAERGKFDGILSDLKIAGVMGIFEAAIVYPR